MDYRALVYSKDDCPWCERALNLLEAHGYPIRVLKYGEDFTKEDLIEMIGPDRRPTVPQIYLDHKYVGGYEDLKVHLEEKHGLSAD